MYQIQLFKIIVVEDIRNLKEKKIKAWVSIKVSIVGKIMSWTRNWEYKGKESKAWLRNCNFTLTKVDSGGCTDRTM